MLISLCVAELEAARWDAIGFVSRYTAIRRNGEYDTGAHGKGEHNIDKWYGEDAQEVHGHDWYAGCILEMWD